ncbi:MAG: L,D-transpeptidase [Candidatus Dormibacteraeota bacterium]|nr:L,D-transpeptidase [Candidatus Dormibacteraeota bacterium]
MLGAAGAGFTYYANQKVVAAFQSYESRHHQLSNDLQAAAKSGYTADDLAGARSALKAVDNQQPPFWLGSRAGFYQTQGQLLSQADTQLQQQQQQLTQQAKDTAAQQLSSAQTGIAHGQQIDVPDPVLAPFSQQLTALTQAQGAAKTISDWRKLDADTKTLVAGVTAAGAAQEQENQAIQQAAAALLQQLAGNIASIRDNGQAALASGRNDATVAAYEGKANRFKDLAPMMTLNDRLEHFAGRLASPDVNQVAYGAAAVGRYQGQIHQLLIQDLGPKHIVVSFQGQHVWAYENGNVVMQSAVTTGIRGVTAYGTDFGPMKVLWRSHPWTMKSPWPKGSQYWYPNTVVQWTAFFTYSGESFHDASWESDSQLGPGSQYDASTRSHGCIHLPYDLAQWTYNWTEVGTPVDVYPGNGQPVAEQLSEMTTDNNGNPINPA